MKTRLIKVSLVCVLLAGLLAALAFWRYKTEAPSVRLADGSILKLEFVGYQRKAPDGRLLRWLDAAGGWLARKLGRPTFSRPPAPTNSLVFWISRRSKHTGTYLDFDWLSHAIAVDSHGCEFNTVPSILVVHSDNWLRGARLLPKAPAGAKYILVSGVLPVFPRREKTFKLRLYDQQLAVVGELKVPNPVYRRYPTWEPEPMPVTHRVGDLAASLVSLSNRWSVARHEGLEVKDFSLTPEFQLSADWELSDLEVQDATGNRGTADPFDRLARFHRRVHWMQNGEPLSSQFRLCTNESAWKVHATFFRTARARFLSNEIWTIPHLKIPAPGTAKILNASNTWQGVTVRLCAIAGAGSMTYSNGVPVRTAISFGGRGGGGGSRMVGGVLVTEMTIDTHKPQVMVRITGLNEESRFQALARTGGSICICSEPGTGTTTTNSFNSTFRTELNQWT